MRSSSLCVCTMTLFFFGENRMANEFKPGDLVQLKSGGAVMTVDEVRSEGAGLAVYCVWQDGNRKFTDDFPAHTLTHWKATP
jgi:uncharacterized protein YodC (DUF2158 family)